MKHIPNFITSLNLVCGFIAIIFASKGDTFSASWLITAAMVFDFLDGFSARTLKAYSEIGRELDSLADVVSFGVAPGFIIYQMLYASLSFPGEGFATGNSVIVTLLLFAPAIMPVCAALRLAIFNLDKSQATVFKGLPTPANALGVILIVFAAHYSDSSVIDSFLSSPLLIILFTIILSLLMVSRISLLSLKFTDFKLKGNEGRLILISLLAVTFAIFGISGAILFIPIYIAASYLSLLF
jgi:CDP-diacylglycerol--serine O-phosphatidyltransferase